MARSRLLAVVCASSAIAVGACAAPSEEPSTRDVGASEDAILGGGVEKGWPAVGMLKFATGNFGTGALIAPKVVLTAAHVAAGHPTHFYFGAPVAGKDPRPENLRSVEVAEVVQHPCYATPKPFFCPGPRNEAIDVAIVRLKTAITDVAPLRMIDWPLEIFSLSPLEGVSCTAVGFGAHLGSDQSVAFGVRRSASSTVLDVAETELVTVRGTGIATSGDSGGPLVCNGLVVGTVRGNAGGAVPNASEYERRREGYERMDLWRGWIGAYVTKWR